MRSTTPIKRRAGALAFLLALAGGSAAPALAQTVDTAASEIAFTTRQLGVPVEGRFARFGARLALDPQQPERGSVALRIETGSARFGSAELDGEVGKPTWLHAAAFPEAVFESSAVRAVAGAPAPAVRYEVAGRLTIKGQSRELVVPVQVTPAAGGERGRATASGQFVIKRLDFRIGDGEWTDTSLLANEVAVRFRFALVGWPRP